MNFNVRLFSVTAYDLNRGAARQLGLDLERDRDFRAHQPGWVLEHLVGDAAGVATDARRVERDRAVKPTWRCLSLDDDLALAWCDPVSRSSVNPPKNACGILDAPSSPTPENGGCQGLDRHSTYRAIAARSMARYTAKQAPWMDIGS